MILIRTLAILIIGISAVAHAESISPKGVEKQENTALNNSDKREVIKNLYNFLDWLKQEIQPEQDVHVIQKKIRKYDLKNVEKLRSDLVDAALLEITSGNNIHEQCNYFSLSMAFSMAFSQTRNSLKDLSRCGENKCAIEETKSLVDAIKNYTDFINTAVSKCNNSGVALKISSADIKNKRDNKKIPNALNKQKITKAFYDFRDGLVAIVLLDQDAQMIRKNLKNYHMDQVGKLELNLSMLALIQLESGDFQNDCNYLMLTITTGSIREMIQKTNSCESKNCTEKKLYDLVDQLKDVTKHQETILPKCNELGLL